MQNDSAYTRVEILQGYVRDVVARDWLRDVAEMKYRMGMTDRKIAKKLGASRSKVHYRLSAFVDYLNFIGRERALRSTLG